MQILATCQLRFFIPNIFTLMFTSGLTVRQQFTNIALQARFKSVTLTGAKEL